MDLISIIVPVYNVETYLNRCVDSLLRQTYTELEIILVDDGSTDKSGEICDSYLKIDNRISVIHKINGGLSDARNTGINVAKGRFIGFVDSDDYIHEKMYEVLYQNIIKYEADISTCDFKMFNGEKVEVNINETQNIRIYEKNDVLSLLDGLDTQVVIAVNKLYKKEIFDNYRYEYGKLHEDQWAIHHILFKTKKIIFSDMKLYFYYIRQNSITKSNINKKQIFDLIGAFEDSYKFFKNKGLKKTQTSCAYKAANYVLYYYEKIGQDKLADTKEIRKELKYEIKKIMAENSNVFIRRPIAYSLFIINPWLGIYYRKIKERIYK